MVRAQTAQRDTVHTSGVDRRSAEGGGGGKIVGRGTLAGNGLPFVLVSSASEPGRAHIVSYAYEGAYIGARMHCDCKGFTYRAHCRHAQLVADWLAEGLAALGLPYPPSAPAAPAPPDARETAPLRRSNQPFSLMK